MKLRSLRVRTCAAFTLLVACLLSGLSFILLARARTLDATRAQQTLAAARDRLVHEWQTRDIMASEIAPQKQGPQLLQRARESAEAQEGAEDAQSLALLLVASDNRVTYRSPGHAPNWPLDDFDNWKIARVQRGATQAILALPRFRARLALQRQWESLRALSAVVLLCAALGAWILVGHSLSPINRLSRQARQVASGGAASLQTRLSAPSSDRELVELVETFNALLQALSEDAQSRGRFYAAASHELRTPLQGLAGHLDLALSRQRSAPEYRAALEEAQSQSRRLSSLVAELLRLNQLEMATSKPPAEALDVPDVLESVLRALRPTLEARALKVQTAWPDAEAMIVAAPRTHLEMLLRNVLDNAAKYTPVGGAVRVSLMSEAKGVVLEVWNACAPQEGWQIEKWCEPFFRPDASRRSQTGGSGLGLAVVKALCDANGWTLTLHAASDGVCATVFFPVAIEN